MSKILVFAETHEQVIKNVSFEILSHLEDHDLDVVTIGKHSEGCIESLKKYNVKNVFEINSSELENYSPEGFSQSISKLNADNNYDYIFAGATSMGKDFFPRLSALLSTGLASDLVELRQENGEFVGTKPFFAGKCLADAKCLGEKPHLMTFRPNALGLKEMNAGSSFEVKKVESSFDQELRAKIKEVVKSASEKLDLTEANIIVSGGRAMGNSENFKLLDDLADVLGATVGASRAAVDSGYAPHAMQVGQTGKTVAPSLYIACGISGAIQHLAGMRTSKIIVAINTDKDAPIFGKADYGIVGDLFKIVPMMTEEFNKILR